MVDLMLFRRSSYGLFFNDVTSFVARDQHCMFFYSLTVSLCIWCSDNISIFEVGTCHCMLINVGMAVTSIKTCTCFPD